MGVRGGRGGSERMGGLIEGLEVTQLFAGRMESVSPQDIRKH